MLFLSCFLIASLVSAFKDQQEMKVKPEQDVTLQCRAPRDASITLLEWNRPDLKKDGYVFFYRNERSYENYLHPSFRGRVELRDPEMKDGDASVVLKNVSINDTGTYECRIIIINAGRNEMMHSEIRHLIDLTVTDSAGNIWAGDKDGGNMDGYLGVVVGLSVIGVLLVFVIVGIICRTIFRKRKRLPERNSYKPPAENAGDEQPI